MNFNEYQDQAQRTAVYKREHDVPYLALGLGNEAGEVQGVVKKYLRGDYGLVHMGNELLDEMGDVLWYLSELARAAGWSLDDVAQENLRKLASRSARGTIKGDGDKR